MADGGFDDELSRILADEFHSMEELLAATAVIAAADEPQQVPATTNGDFAPSTTMPAPYHQQIPAEFPPAMIATLDQHMLQDFPPSTMPPVHHHQTLAELSAAAAVQMQAGPSQPTRSVQHQHVVHVSSDNDGGKGIEGNSSSDLLDHLLRVTTEETAVLVPISQEQLHCEDCHVVTEVRHVNERVAHYFTVHIDANDGRFLHAIVARSHNGVAGQELLRLGLSSRTHAWVLRFIARCVETMRNEGGTVEVDTRGASGGGGSSSSASATTACTEEAEIDMLCEFFVGSATAVNPAAPPPAPTPTTAQAPPGTLGELPTSAYDQTTTVPASGDEGQDWSPMNDEDIYHLESLFANDQDLAATIAASDDDPIPIQEPPMAPDETTFTPLMPGQLRCVDDKCSLFTEVRHYDEGRVKYLLVHCTADGTAFKHAIMYDTYTGVDKEVHMSNSTYLDLRRRAPEWVRRFIADHIEMYGDRVSMAEYVNSAGEPLPEENPSVEAATSEANEAHMKLEIDMLRNILSGTTDNPEAAAEVAAPAPAPVPPPPPPPPPPAAAAPTRGGRKPRIINSSEVVREARETAPGARSKLSRRQRQRAAAAEAEPIDEEKLRAYLAGASKQAKRELARPSPVLKSFSRGKLNLGAMRTKIHDKNKKIVKEEEKSHGVVGRELANIGRKVDAMVNDKENMYARLREAMEDEAVQRQCRSLPPPGPRDDGPGGPGGGGAAGVGLV